VVDRHSADPPGPGSPWAQGSIERLRSGVAATSRIRPLFPAGRADLIEDDAWTGVARLVREQAAAVVTAGDYPFEDFYAEDPVVVDQVAALVFATVLDRLPPTGALTDGAGKELRLVLEELIRHRLQVLSADRAGRRLSLSVPGFDLVAWAARIRMAPIGKEDDDLLAFSDNQLGYFVSRRQDAVVVEMTSRSRQRWLLGNFDSEADALRFLVLRIGADWRQKMGRRLLGGAQLRPGMALEDGPTATHLTWPGGWADFPKGLAGRSAALRFSRIVGWPAAQIVELYESRFGKLPTEP
jgi:hypothetical protein